MRPAILAFAGILSLSCVGCGQSYTFEEALIAGKLNWLPVKNVEVRTKSGNATTVQAVEFTTKIKYDSAGRGSPDTTGQKTYKWAKQGSDVRPWSGH